MNKSTFEDVLRDRGELIYTNVGDSMYPLIVRVTCSSSRNGTEIG